MQLSDEQIVQKLGKSVREHRISQGLTQGELGTRCSMEEAAIRRIELGKHFPTFKTLLRVSRGLGISLLDLLDFLKSEQENDSK